MDPGRFHSGRWFLLIEGVLVSAFGVVGLVSAALHPHAGPTGAPVLGLTSTPAHSGVLLALGLVAITAVVHRRAAVTVTAVSAVGYTMLLFFSSVATARRVPTPMGFHASDILLHGILGVVNLALLMWLIPDELGDEVWAPRRRRGRDRREPPAPEAATAPVPAPAPVQESGAPTGMPESAAPPVSVPEPLERSSSEDSHEPSAFHGVETDAVRSRRAAVAVAVLAAVVVIAVWLRRRGR
ncbi:hypothetical protein A5706_19760 [Mycobacterium sp. E796]|nr:hypothetical protein A5706_19760 [Mycobacterium sp. E796]